MYKYGYIAILFLSLYSCDFFHLKNKETTEDIVASVGSTHLYKSDLESLYDPDLSGTDSILITNNFIENWARKQIILQKATFNLTPEKELELKSMIDDYRDDLYINSYKDALVSQNLDTLVHRETIKNFYIANQNVFRLKEEIIQFRYMNFHSESRDRKELKKLFLTSKSIALDSILYKDYKFTINQLNDSTWFSYKEFVKTNPIMETLKKSQVLRKNHFIEVKDSVNTHFIKINDIKVRNEIAPLEHVSQVIKQMIIHKKKLKYINELDNKLIEDAVKNNTFKKY